MMAEKLGLNGFTAATDDSIIGDLVDILQLVETDMTIFYRKLATISTETLAATDSDLLAPLMDAYYNPEEVSEEYKNRMNS